MPLSYACSPLWEYTRFASISVQATAMTVVRVLNIALNTHYTTKIIQSK